MTRPDLYRVIEALKSADTELRALADEDIHIPSGDLFEQVAEALEILEALYADVRQA